MPTPLLRSDDGADAAGVGDAFATLLRSLESEHARIVEERDYYRQKWASGSSANSTSRNTDAAGSVIGLAEAPGERPPMIDAALALKADGGHPGAGRVSSKGRIETPRLVRNLRPSGSRMSGVAVGPLGSFRSGATDDADPDVLRLDPRWLDVYVSQQMQARLGPGVSKACSSFEMELWDNRARMQRSVEGAMPCQPPKMCSGDAQQSVRTMQPMLHEVPFAPHHVGRVAWSLVAGPLILYDLIAIPWQIAWNESQPLALSLLTTLYWTLDIIVELNTGFLSPAGHVVKNRKAVTRRYVWTRFFVDATMTSLDIVAILSVDTIADMSWYRFVRSLRALRIVRAFRLSAVRETLDELMFKFGIDRLLLILNVGQTILSIFVLAHISSCAWYFLGRAQMSAGSASWLESFVEAGALDEYLHSVHYALGHLLGGPVNPHVMPTTDAEHFFSVAMIAGSVVVVGTFVSKMTNSIADLHRGRLEAMDTKRKLSQVLRASGADADLSSRILKFGMHCHDRRASLSVEGSVMQLLSQALASELTVCQRSRYFVEHALLNRLRGRFPEIFARICGAFVANIFADSDIVFRPGTLSDCLYITARGQFMLTTPIKHWRRLQRRCEHCGDDARGAKDKRRVEATNNGDAVVTHLNGVHWLCEVSMFATAVHKSELRTASFADAFALTGAALIACIEKSPSCVSVVYQYARDYLRFVNASQDADGDVEIVPPDLPHTICEKVFTEEEANSCQEGDGLDSPAADVDRTKMLIDDIMSGAFDIEKDIADILPEVFGELHPQHGIYQALKMEGERRRAIAAMVSVVHLIQNDYDAFTASQGVDSMTKDLWDVMQRFVEWIGLTKEIVHAILVFLAIRGIGKATPFLQAMPRDEQTPEVVVLTLLSDFQRKVPSCDPLTSAGRNLVEKAFELHRAFNFAQFLQGENTPRHISILQSIIHEHEDGQEMLRFYLFSLVGVMCGLRGEESLQGSLFLNQVNGEMLVAGVHVLQNLQTASPCGIYWAFLAERAAALQLDFSSLEQIAFVRLACLARTVSGDIGNLQKDWLQLSVADRRTLVEHFVADGISSLAFAFTFLPAYLANAKRNPAVGMSRALMVLVELIDTLQRDGYAEKIGARMLTVNLQELADFTKTVESPSAFMVVHVHSSLARRRGALDFVISARHKQDAAQTNWSDDPTNELRALMRRVERRVDCVNQQLERVPEACRTSSRTS